MLIGHLPLIEESPMPLLRSVPAAHGCRADSSIEARDKAPARTARALLLAPFLIAVLAGCAVSQPPSDVSSSVAETLADTGSDVDTEAAPDVVAQVNAADLPDWFPADLPMPAGEYRWTTVDDAGAFLQFTISGESVIEDLVTELEAAGYAVTAVDDHGEGWKTWFTESETYRVNIAARDLGTDAAYIDYRVEPK